MRKRPLRVKPDKQYSRRHQLWRDFQIAPNTFAKRQPGFGTQLPRLFSTARIRFSRDSLPITSAMDWVDLLSKQQRRAQFCFISPRFGSVDVGTRNLAMKVFISRR